MTRLRYQILETKKAIQPSDVTYWYQDLPTAGVFSIVGSSVGINDTTPDYTLDLETGTFGTSGNITSDGNITTTGDDVDISTHTTIAGNLTVTGSTTFSDTKIIATLSGTQTPTCTTNTALQFTSEGADTLSEWSTNTFTATTAGYYLVSVNVNADDGANPLTYLQLDVNKNGGATYLIADVPTSGTTGNVMNLSYSKMELLAANDTLAFTVNPGCSSGTASLFTARNWITITRVR